MKCTNGDSRTARQKVADAIFDWFFETTAGADAEREALMVLIETCFARMSTADVVAVAKTSGIPASTLHAVLISAGLPPKPAHDFVYGDGNDNNDRHTATQE
jgi:hypothetical protein